MTVTDWIVAIVAVGALALSMYNTYTQRRDRTPRVEMAARWNLPRDVPQASKGPGFPATANPGEAIFECEITNVGIAGAKIREVYVYIDAPPGKPIPLYLPQGEQPRRLESGDSQMWSAGPFEYDRIGPFEYDRIGRGENWIRVLALDTVGNIYEAKNLDFVPSYLRRNERPWWRRVFGR